MEILPENLKREIKESVVIRVEEGDYLGFEREIDRYLSALHENIPVSRKSSCGVVYTVKVLSNYIFSVIDNLPFSPLVVGKKLYNVTLRDSDRAGKVGFKTRTVALGILSLYGLDEFVPVLEYFECSADSDYWNEREIFSILFRKLIARHRKDIKEYLLELVKSNRYNIRRFVAESLRPVVENKWFFDEIDYPLSIISHLFTEPHPYPRTSVGNNLSDISKRLPEVVFSLVEKLVSTGNKNSYWIAYRACRNLVKRYPERVMNLLGIEEYRYKDRVYRL